MHNQDPDKPQSEEDLIWQGLAAINRTQSSHSAPKTVDEAIKQLRKELLTPQEPELISNISIQERIHAAILSLTGRTPGTEALIEWLRRTGEFSEKDLRLIRRVKLFYEGKSGQSLMRETGIALETATFQMMILCVVAGIWIGYIIFADRVGILEISNSFALGLFFGAIAGMLLDRSFRFKRIRDKVASIAPWLTQPAA